MSIETTSSISALNAFGDRQSVTAHNLANSLTDGYQVTRAHLVEGPASSVLLQTVKDPSPDPSLRDADGATSQASNVDTARELSDMIPTQHAYTANLKALQVTDEMIGTLLDLKA